MIFRLTAYYVTKRLRDIQREPRFRGWFAGRVTHGFLAVRLFGDKSVLENPG